MTRATSPALPRCWKLGMWIMWITGAVIRLARPLMRSNGGRFCCEVNPCSSVHFVTLRWDASPAGACRRVTVNHRLDE